MKGKKLVLLTIIVVVITLLSLGGGVYYKNNTPSLTVVYHSEKGEIMTTVYKLSSNFRVVRAYRKKRISTLYKGLLESSNNQLKSLNYICPEIAPDIVRLENKVNFNPVNADVIFDKNKEYPFEFTKEVSGRRLNREILIEKLFKNIDEGRIEIKIDVPLDVISPETKLETLKNRFVLLSSFSTFYSDSPLNRKDNIALATSQINGTEIKSGEIFSYNNVVGPRTLERGFKMAKIINKGVFEEGIGGGVCQVSTTLYNTALMSGAIGIVNRQHHSLPVHYVPLGLDAMVSATNDLSFANLSNYSVFITGKADGNRITFSIYGEKQPYKVKLTSRLIEIVDFTSEEMTDNTDTVPKGEKKILIQGSQGYKVSSYKEYYEDGNLVKTELISNDFYVPQKCIILVGR